MSNLNLFYLILFCSVIFFFSCNNEPIKDVIKVTNSGVITSINGKGEKDSIKFRCIGCEEYIKTIALFDKVMEEANLIAKNSLKFPLSYVPISVDLTVIKEDSLYYFDNNTKIENVLQVISRFSYIAKNSYGNELEGESLNSFYIKDEKITDLENEIKLKKLRFDDKYINRTLAGYGSVSEYIEFTPTKDKSIIFKSSLGCVDEGASLKIILENDDEIELKSWNDFNCDGTSYFDWFNHSQINKLKTGKLKYLYIYSRGESVMVNIPKNKSDYFQQLFNLY